jgi:hypothetical protein
VTARKGSNYWQLNALRNRGGLMRLEVEDVGDDGEQVLA